MTARKGRRPTPLTTRFWDKVQRGGAEVCWPWVARRDRGGYGQFWYNRRQTIAHRVAWTIAKGPIPDGLCVLHHCDNRPCVNPAHLFLGTNADNAHDAMLKGRLADRRGEANGQSKLTEDDVLGVRAARAAGETEVSIARRYHVSQTTISHIVRGKKWAHLRSQLEGA